MRLTIGGITNILEEGLLASEIKYPWPIHFSRDILAAGRSAFKPWSENYPRGNFYIVILHLDKYRIKGWVEDEDGGYAQENVEPSAILNVFAYNRRSRKFELVIADYETRQLFMHQPAMSTGDASKTELEIRPGTVPKPNPNLSLSQI